MAYGYIHALEILPQTVSDALEQLDEAVSHREEYRQTRITRADSLKILLAGCDELDRLKYCEAMGNVYSGMDMDSAAYYYSAGIKLAEQLGDSIVAQRLMLLKASILPVGGAVREAINIYESYTETDIYPENLIVYYETGNRLYFYICAFYNGDEYYDDYADKGKYATEQLLKILPEGTVKYKFFQAKLYTLNLDYPMAIANFHDIIDNAGVYDNFFARATNMLANYYEGVGKKEDAAYYYAISAISDVLSGTREELSLQQLGVVLFELGDVSRAYKYLTLSLNNAIDSGSKMRALESLYALPIIAYTFRTQDQRKLTWLTVMVICLIIALLVIIGISMFLKRGIDKRDKLKQHLVESNYVKEEYISQFLNLSSIYIEKLEEFHRIAGRKIKAGQIEDLYELIKSGKMLEEHSKHFYDVFDNAFVHIYPTFVKDVNELFHEDKRILLTDNLNTEMRVLAFMRLGIDDSAQIARFLGLSLNTVYTYRNKLKSRALKRETFEQDVMKIGSIS